MVLGARYYWADKSGGRVGRTRVVFETSGIEIHKARLHSLSVFLFPLPLALVFSLGSSVGDGTSRFMIFAITCFGQFAVAYLIELKSVATRRLPIVLGVKGSVDAVAAIPYEDILAIIVRESAPLDYEDSKYAQIYVDQTNSSDKPFAVLIHERSIRKQESVVHLAERIAAHVGATLKNEID